MQIKLLHNAESIRTVFENKFLLIWPEFQALHADSIAQRHFDKACFDSSFMWDRMRPECPTISFQNALALLRRLPGEVLFLSEGPDYPSACALKLEGKPFPHFIAAADARELADLIEYEWMEEARLFPEDCYLANKILPDDLYVLTSDMDRMLVFTHETDDYEAELTEDYIKVAKSRVCIACGFDTLK